MIDPKWVGCATSPVAIKIHSEAANLFQVVLQTSPQLERSPSFIPSSGHGDPLAKRIPFTFPITFWHDVEIPWLDNYQGILLHGEQKFAYIRELKSDERVICQIHLKNLNLKQGKTGSMQIVDHEMTVIGEDGTQILTSNSTLVLPLLRPESRNELSRFARMPIPTPSRSLLPIELQGDSWPNVEEFSIGMELPAISIAGFTKDRLGAYAWASRDDNPLHLDEDYAHHSGMKARVVHGMLVMGAVAELLSGLETSGAGVFLHGFSVRFMKPVFENETLVLQAKVEDVIHSSRSLKPESIQLGIQILRGARQDEPKELCLSGTAHLGVSPVLRAEGWG